MQMATGPVPVPLGSVFACVRPGHPEREILLERPGVPAMYDTTVERVRVVCWLKQRPGAPGLLRSGRR